MKEETENMDKTYIVKKRKNNSFYNGSANYTTDLYGAKLYNENEIPKEIKNNPDLKIIPLYSEEGLEIILHEINKVEKYISVKSNSLGNAIAGLYKLQNLLSKNNNKA